MKDSDFCIAHNHLQEENAIHELCDYKPEYCEQIIDYFCKDPIETKTVQKVIKGNVYNIQQEMPVRPPTMAGFCVQLRICRDTLYNWKKLFPAFKKACAIAKEGMENIWTVNGALGFYNPQITMMVGKQPHNFAERWVDKTEEEENNNEPVQIIDNIPKE